MTAGTTVTLLVAAARAQGERIAVESHEAPPLSYAELLARASALAGVLRAEGIGRGDLVGLDLEKSAAYVIALLGVWLSGAAFLPLGPELPPERRRFILDEARPRRVLDAAVVGTGGTARAKGTQGSQELGVPCVPCALAVSPLFDDDLAYVIYTSGSTGAPKGVMVPHRGLPGLLEAQIAAFGLGPGSRVLFHLSTSFDASISDIGTALASGATLVIEPAARLASAAGLVEALHAGSITHADLPPSLLPVIDPARLPASFSTVVIGGEPCPPEAVRRWAERVRVVNVYGPTEATVCSSLCACDARTWSAPLLGSPLPGVRYRVVDVDLAPVPDGTPGELVIGGAGVALGYVGPPERTAERFVHVGGERVYRTGDRVVRRADGEIEILGRIDRQVKLRGLRIEPEEIEARLASHPGVTSAAVVVRPLFGARGPRRLVAFVAPRDPEPPDLEAALRRHLAGALPGWMIPARICALPALPRTLSGKVDLAALETAPIARPAVPAARWTGPAAVLEALWCEVLGVPAVAAGDDFGGTLGGDSVALVEAAARAEAAGLPIPAERMGDPRATFGDLVRGMEDPRARAGARRTAAELRDDVAGELRELRAPADDGGPGGAVLLTGAAGAFGACLLEALLARGGAPVVCVVRARDDAEAHGRVAHALAQLGGALPAGRVRAIAGDLARPRFGLEEHAWDRLAGEIATIVHAAARVDGVSPYEALRRDNVEATREVVRLACTGRRKHLHHVSTLSVLAQAERTPDDVVTRDDRTPGDVDARADLRGTRAVLGGYAQSKWAAEHLVRATGIPAAVFRLGLLAPGDHLLRFFRGLRELGCAPFPRAPLEIDVTPAAQAAAAVVARATAEAAEGRRTIHVAAPEPATIEDVLDAAREAGAHVADVPREAWSARARARLGSTDAAVAYLSLCRCLGEEALGRHRGLDLFEATGLRLGGIAGLAAPRDTLRDVARAALAAAI